MMTQKKKKKTHKRQNHTHTHTERDTHTHTHMHQQPTTHQLQPHALYQHTHTKMPPHNNFCLMTRLFIIITHHHIINCCYESIVPTQNTMANCSSGAGIDWTFPPMVDVARDQRWGRASRAAARTRCSAACSPQRGFAASRAPTSVRRAPALLHQAFRSLWRRPIGPRLRCRDMSVRRLREVYLRRTRPGSTRARYRPWPRSMRSTACPRPAATG